mmetsp:Transcript_1781/g.4631  ORF Transcript_1781/g.4631 Transcript_1781/m.4631 type:complete len:118 (+) Transcript_1781:238-591(+)
MNDESARPWQRYRGGVLRRIIRRRSRGRGLFGHGSHDDRDATPEGRGEPTVRTRRGGEIHLDEDECCSASILLECLPGFRDGRFGHLAKGLLERQMHDEQEEEEEIRRSMHKPTMLP